MAKTLGTETKTATSANWWPLGDEKLPIGARAMLHPSMTVEEVRDASPEPLSTWLESSVWTLATRRARVMAWTECRPDESVWAASNRIVDREFARALDLSLLQFLDELGGELADEIDALINDEQRIAA